MTYEGMWTIVTAEEHFIRNPSTQTRKNSNKIRALPRYTSHSLLAQSITKGYGNTRVTTSHLNNWKPISIGDIYHARERAAEQLETINWKTVSELVTTFRTRVVVFTNLEGIMRAHELSHLLLELLQEKYASLKIQLDTEASQ